MKKLNKTKQIILSSLCAAVAVAGLGAGVVAGAKHKAEQNSIGIDKAISIALTDAGVSETEAVFTKAKMELEKGVIVYDVEFNTPDFYEYDYSIKADSGAILDKSKEKDDDAVLTSAPTTKTEVQTTTDAQPKPTEAQVTTTVKALVTTSEQQTTTKPQSSQITSEQAKDIALKHAGLSRKDVSSLRAKKDFDDGAWYYDIEFFTKNYEYDYEIDLNGKILSFDKEARKTAPKPQVTTTQKVTQPVAKPQPTTKPQATKITAEQAKDIALKHAGLSRKDVSRLTAKKDYDDGVQVYDVEFLSAKYEFEYEIGMNGKIRSVDKEARKTAPKPTVPTTQPTTKPQSNFIGADKAKQTALQNAGLKASDVTFKKVKLEKDDGIYVYDIEFVTAKKEFEYEINAKTGKIVDKSIEARDFDD